MSNKRYATIVVDPPWEYDSWPPQMSNANPKPGGPWNGKRMGPIDPTRRKSIDYPTMRPRANHGIADPLAG